MKKIVTTILILLLVGTICAQDRVVLNDDAYITIDNSAFVVLDNPNANALSILGTGGNIVSEAEADVIKWNIGTTTGTYVIPWTTLSGIKIPLSITKATAGVGATANFTLSTWETTDVADMNLPMPTMVTNMNLPSAANGSLFVADRFWHINALSYATKPGIELIINYDPAATEIGINNTITETNLLAQRFNTTLGHWETYKLFGTNDAGNDRVTGIVVPAADFFENWILVDESNPLPVELTSFEVSCESGKVAITWTTQSEINNDFFVLEKSYDAQVFFELTTIAGAGNSNVVNTYSVTDENPEAGTVYYRLKQVDFNGATTFHQIQATSCGAEVFSVTQFVLNKNQLKFEINANENEGLNIYLFDSRGRVVLSKNHFIKNGSNVITLGNLNLSVGIYMLTIIGEKHRDSIKLMRR